MEIIPKPLRHTTEIVFLVCTVSYGSLVFPLRFMAHALRTWAINQRVKKLVHNLQYGPRTQLVRGMSVLMNVLKPWL